MIFNTETPLHPLKELKYFHTLCTLSKVISVLPAERMPGNGISKQLKVPFYRWQYTELGICYNCSWEIFQSIVVWKTELQ